jgi:hypothetical protein
LTPVEAPTRPLSGIGSAVIRCWCGPAPGCPPRLARLGLGTENADQEVRLPGEQVRPDDGLVVTPMVVADEPAAADALERAALPGVPQSDGWVRRPAAAGSGRTA